MELLLTLQQVVLRYWKAATGGGVRLAGVGTNVQAGRLVLSVENPSPRVDSELDVMFGSSNIGSTERGSSGSGIIGSWHCPGGQVTTTVPSWTRAMTAAGWR